MIADRVQVQPYSALQSLAPILPSWERLLSETPSATVFTSWEWLAPWWNAFGGDQQSIVLAFFNVESKLVAIAPLVLTARFGLRSLQLMGDGSGDSDNLDLLARPGSEDAVAAAFLRWLNNNSCSWDICEFTTMPLGSPVLTALMQQLDRNRFAIRASHRPCSAVSLPSSWHEYLDRLSAEDRQNIPRYRQRLERRFAVEFHKCMRQNELDAALDILFELHTARWNQRGEHGAFASARRRQFYRELAPSLFAQGRLEFWLLILDGRPVAAQFAARFRDTVYQLQEGFDPGHHSDRVGLVLRAHVIEELIAQGVRRYDFLGGYTSHKARWGAQAGSYVTLRFAHRNTLGAVAVHGLHMAGDMKEWLRTHAPENAWNMMHRIKMRCAGTESWNSRCLHRIPQPRQHHSAGGQLTPDPKTSSD